MPNVTKHISLVPIDGLDYAAHIAKHFGPTVSMKHMGRLGISFTSRNDSDSRTIICLQADSSDQDALDAAAKAIPASGVEELTEAEDTSVVSGLLTVAAILQPAYTGVSPEGVMEDHSAPLVDEATGKLSLTVSPT